MDVAGRLARMTLERDINMAGYGFGAAASPSAIGSTAAMGCTVTSYDAGRPGGSQDFSYVLAPVVIVDGASGASDSISVLKGSSSFLSFAKTIDQSTATTVRVKADTGGRPGVQRGDVVVAVNAGGGLTCGMYEITGDANTDQLTFDHNVGVTYTTASGQSKQARYNKTGGISFTLTGDGRMYNLGATPARTTWFVQNNRLVARNDLRWVDSDADGNNDTVEAADMILNLQAEYGVDANNDGMIASSEWTTTTPTDWTRLLAIRFALLTRDGQYERTQITTTAPRWSGGTFTMTNVDGTSDSNPTGTSAINNWRNYRYNVFEAVVPLRNTLIGKQL
jgi:type IV pilus assembly protein PilW